MSVYLDTSVMVSLFTKDDFSSQADVALRAQPVVHLVSDFGAAEFASAVARRFRMRDMTEMETALAFADFDHWRANIATHIVLESVDIVVAEAIVRRLDLLLRAPDAIHLAIAQRIGAELATFDEKMAAGARALGLSLAKI